MKRKLRWSIIDSSTGSLTLAVELRGALSIIISKTPDCTTYMQVPGAPRENTTLPAGSVTFAPAFLANVRMSIVLKDVYKSGRASLSEQVRSAGLSDYPIGS